MATLTAQTIDNIGTAITLVAAGGGGDLWVPTGDDRTFLWIKNGGGGTITLTVTVPGQTFGQNNADVAVSVPNGAERMVGPLVPDLVAAETFGFVVFAYSGVTSVTVAVVQVGNPSLSLLTA